MNGVAGGGYDRFRQPLGQMRHRIVPLADDVGEQVAKRFPDVSETGHARLPTLTLVPALPSCAVTGRVSPQLPYVLEQPRAGKAQEIEAKAGFCT